jgi:N-acetyl-anhydromuramyl-L-alanine amidase AmpD
MVRPLYDTESIFGLHDAGGERLFLESNRSGWIVFSEAIGHDPEDRSSVDFTRWSDQGLGVICRLSHGFPPDGTIPHSSLYEEFARRVASFVGNSAGCKIWIIGNEMNYAVERPGVQVDWSRHASARATTPEQADPMRRGLVVRFNVLPDHSTEIRTTRGALISPGEVITPELYARCYRLCRDAILRQAGHADDQVLVGAVTPWNSQTIYPGNANGDWVQYFRDILEQVGPAYCGGFALHTYTHGGDPAQITSEEKLGPPYQSRHREFRAYTDFMAAIPEAMRHLPVYVTETDQTDPWLDVNSGWVRSAYAEIDGWNKQPDNQQIRALVLYRWPKLDKWHIAGKEGVLEDLRSALHQSFAWRGAESPVVAAAEEHMTPTREAPIVVERPPAREENGKRHSERESAKPAKTYPYRAQWLDDRFPARLSAGQVVSAPVTVKNAGTLAWTVGGSQPFRIGYRYYRNRRLLSLGEDKDLRTDVPHEIAPGESVTLTVRVALPDQPGNYTLELDMLQDGVTWFKEQGSPVLTRWLTVEAPRREVKLDGTDTALPVPLFSDVTTALPRAGTPYARRGLNQIRYIVVSHTGANPRLSLDRIAETHIQYGYPGIVYDFVIDSHGQVYKVTNLEDVAQPDQVWSEQGVNICLAGNFSVGAPPLAQLDATGRLCAWLAQNLGLSPDAIVGLGELSKSDSPGESFYRGPAWKGILARQVRLHLAAFSGAGESGRVQELTTNLVELRERNRELQEQLDSTQGERIRLDSVALRLEAEVAELRRQLETQTVETAGGVRIYKWIDQLPRDEKRYRSRTSQDVRNIVVHHTGMHAETPLAELAEVHRQEWPGLLFDYVIDGAGEIYQTQPLDQVVDTAEEFLTNAVSVAFAGEFSDAIPSNEQLDAGGRLLAWLLERFPHLRIEQIRGACELTDLTSPGTQWLDGQRWREMLAAAVRRHRGLVEPSEVETQLRSKATQYEHELQVAERTIQLLQEQKTRLQAEQQRLLTQVADTQQETRAYVIPQPAIRSIAAQLPAHPTLRYERRTTSQITHIAIHHTATPPSVSPARIAELHVAADASRGKEPWPGIGYHYFVHADGSVDQTNSLESASYHVHRHNMYSAGIVFVGSFMNGRIPTSAQLRSGAHLVAWLMQELGIPLARVWGHREFPDNTTVCPGSEWTMGNRWRDLLFERIEQIQAGIGVKSVRHYLLFWQRPYPGPLARQDFVNAINYIVRFRPAVGFSVHDARNAEYVTIVGSEAGISAAEEETLRSSGCKVERVAGRDEEETSRLLADMASSGRRFRSFDVDIA